MRSTPSIYIRRLPLRVFGALWLSALLGLSAACASIPTAVSTSQSGGTYTDAQYHFKITYPRGWQAKVLYSSATSLQFAVQPINEQDPRGLNPSVYLDISSLQGLVGGASEVEAEFAKKVGSVGFSVVTISGKTAYEDGPVTEHQPNRSLTQNDYYLIYDDKEYHFAVASIDTISGNAQTVQMIFQSFTII